MAASAIDLDVSMDYLEPDDDDSSFDDENFNPNQKAKKTTASGGKVAGANVAVTKTTTKQTTTTKPTTATASQKTIEQTYQKKTQLEVRFGPHLTIYLNSPSLCLANSYNNTLPMTAHPPPSRHIHWFDGIDYSTNVHLRFHNESDQTT